MMINVYFTVMLVMVVYVDFTHFNYSKLNIGYSGSNLTYVYTAHSLFVFKKYDVLSTMKMYLNHCI